MSTTPGSEPIDPLTLRRAFGAFATGVTVVTTVDASGRRWGMTANSFSSVSLDPPLVMWSQARSAGSHAAFVDASRFAVHLLGEGQIDLSRRFAGGTPSTDRFEGLAVREGLGGVPLLEGCVACFECWTETIHPGGDHVVFVGRLLRHERRPGSPLAYADGRYAVVRPHPDCAPEGAAR